MEKYSNIINVLSIFLENVIEIHPDEIDTSRGPYQTAYLGDLNIEEKQFSLIVGLPTHFPVEKPHFFIQDINKIGFIPHIEKDGWICYAHEEGLLLDQDNPLGILKEAIQRTITTLSLGIRKENQADYQKEFEAYWSRQPNAKLLDSIFIPDEKIRKVHIYRSPSMQKSILIDQMNTETKQYLSNLYKVDDINKHFQKDEGIYIPLRRGTKLPPISFNSLWDIKTLKKLIFQNVTTSTKRNLQRYLKQTRFNKFEHTYILLSFPIENNQRVLFGFEWWNFKKKNKIRTKNTVCHPLHQKQAIFDVNPLVLKRHDRPYLLERTIRDSHLKDKTVTIIGLGSIGSRISLELAKAGIESFNLIDEDYIDIDNVFRHELGVSDLYLPVKEKGFLVPSKVDAMTAELQRRLPFIKVKGRVKNILDLIDAEEDIFSQSDLIIVALGSPTVELFLNRIIKSRDQSPPILFTWLDPLGIGGHALLTNNLKSTNSGCLQCLFTHPQNPGELIQNRASFAASDQFFGKTLAGCVNMFTPYGSIDALQTALLATRLAIRTLRREELGNPLYSWKGDHTTFQEKGFTFSSRFQLTQQELDEHRYDYCVPSCTACGG